jgi:hypothetical protein
MTKLLLRLWRDDCGALIAAEWIFVATILCLGSIVGLVAVRKAIIEELSEVAKDCMKMHHHSRHHRHDDGDDEDGNQGGQDDRGAGDDKHGHEHDHGQAGGD